MMKLTSLAAAVAAVVVKDLDLIGRQDWDLSDQLVIPFVYYWLVVVGHRKYLKYPSSYPIPLHHKFQFQLVQFLSLNLHCLNTNNK